MDDYENTSEADGWQEARREGRNAPRVVNTRHAGTRTTARGRPRMQEKRVRRAGARHLPRYCVVVKTQVAVVSYIATGDRDKLMDAAYDLYGACGITLRPL